MGGIGDTAVVATAPRTAAAASSPSLAARVRTWWLWPLALGLALLAFTEAYLLVQFWPATAGAGQAVPADSADVTIFGQVWTAVPRETLFFLVVILGGGLGGTIHSLRSLAWYVGSQHLTRSWALRYCYLPLVGALLALALYVIVRAGFLAGTSVDASSPYGFVALGMLAGLFSDQGITKLKSVFEVVLSEPDQGPASS